MTDKCKHCAFKSYGYDTNGDKKFYCVRSNAVRPITKTLQNLCVIFKLLNR